MGQLKIRFSEQIDTPDSSFWSEGLKTPEAWKFWIQNLSPGVSRSLKDTLWGNGWKSFPKRYKKSHGLLVEENLFFAWRPESWDAQLSNDVYHGGGFVWSKWVKIAIFSKKMLKKQRFWGTQFWITWLWRGLAPTFLKIMTFFTGVLKYMGHKLSDEP